MNFAVADDCVPEAETLKTLILKYCTRQHVDCDISLFHSAEELRASFKPDKFHILFLDIFLEPGQALGVELGRELLGADENLKLVFCTSSPDFAAQGFHMNAAYYLVKPIIEAGISEALARLSGVMERDARFISLRARHKKHDVFLKDILYAEVYGNETIVHTATGEVLPVLQPLGRLEEEIREAGGNSGCFLRCHKSYLVNMNHVEKADDDGDFLMINGDKVLIRLQNGKSVKRLLFEFKVRQARSGTEAGYD